MTLRAIRHGGEIVGFEWDYVSPAAARMFLGAPIERSDSVYSTGCLAARASPRFFRTIAGSPTAWLLTRYDMNT
jgi:hypothetical protein